VTPIRVLMVTGAYYPEISSGGLQARLVSAAMRGEAEVRVLTTALDLTTPSYSRVDEVEVTRMHLRSMAVLSKASAVSIVFPDILKLVRWCDVVHIHGVSSKNALITAAARLFRKPVVVSLHTTGADEPEAIRQGGRWSWWAFRSAARYMSVSAGLKQRYLDAGLPPDRIEQVGNGIDTSEFRPASKEEKRRLRRSLGLNPDRPLVLFVGFFSQDKQPRLLFDAWLQLRDQYGIDASLVYVGATKSDYYEVDESLAGGMRADADARGVGDRLTFTGSLHDVHEYFRLADVFVLPSRREGLPVALMEAMSCGLPCVASNLPGATDTLIEDRVSGLLVPPHDVAAFTAAINVMLTDTARAARMGAAAREFVAARFGAETIAARWLANYRIVLGRSGVDRT
jgi:glycosyltransferase involved in cell wall biosynthesis